MRSISIWTHATVVDNSRCVVVACGQTLNLARRTRGQEVHGAGRVGRISASAGSLATPEATRRMFGWNRCNAASNSVTGRRSLSTVDESAAELLGGAKLMSECVSLIMVLPPIESAEWQPSCRSRRMKQLGELTRGAR